MVEESGGGGHAAAEDGGGEFARGPEGWGLEVVGLVGTTGLEGDDEAHDGGDAGTASAGDCLLVGEHYALTIHSL